MPVLIECPCGESVRGKDEDAAIEAARRHIEERHPDLAGRLSDADLRGMVRQDPTP
jgi:hypothetical protein